MYYIIKWKGYEWTVNDTQDIIKWSCELVNAYGADPEDIEIITIGGEKA